MFGNDRLELVGRTFAFVRAALSDARGTAVTLSSPANSSEEVDEPEEDPLDDSALKEEPAAGSYIALELLLWGTGGDFALSTFAFPDDEATADKLPVLPFEWWC